MSHKPWLLESLPIFTRSENLWIYFSVHLHHIRRGPFESLIRESVMMPTQRSPRYPLRSQDVLIHPDLVGSHKTSVSSRFQTLDGNPQITMPSMIDPVAHAVSGSYPNDKPLFEDGPFINHKALLEWQDFHDAAMLFQDHNGSLPGYCDSRFENVTGDSAQDHLVEQTIWDYAASYNPSAHAYSYSTYPRSFSCSDDIPIRAPTAPVRQTRSRTTYTGESEYPRFPPNSSHQRRLKTPLANPRRGVPQSDIGKSQQSWYTEPRLFTLPPPQSECPAVHSPDMNKGCEDGVSLLNDGESDADASENAEPYAQLIYRALRDAPGYGMVLKDIYDWFEKNTDKAKNPSSKGWQNSIRHNLSMNGVRGQSHYVLKHRFNGS